MALGRRSRLFRGIGALLAGGTLGQGLAVLAAPALTRLYSPADFGALAVFAAIVSISSVFATLRLEVAIVLPNAEEDAVALAWTAGTAAVAIAAAIGLAGPVIARPLADLLSAPSLPTLWWLIAVTTLLVGLFQVLSSWLTRRQQYAPLGVRNFLLGSATAGGQLGLGLLSLGSLGLALGQAVGYFTAVLGLSSVRGLGGRRRRPQLKDLRRVIRRYRRFPLVSSWSALLNSAGQQAPILVVSAIYGQIVVGLLGLTVRVLATPAALVGRAVAQVFLGEAGADARGTGGTLTRQVRITTLSLLAVGAVPAAVLIAAGPGLFGLVFGPEWVEAGHFARFLAVGYLAQFAVSPVSQILLVLERQGSQLVWDAVRLALTCGAPYVAAALGASAQLAVAVLSASFVVSYSSLYVICLFAARRAETEQGLRG